jgi:hypothetical protein
MELLGQTILQMLEISGESARPRLGLPWGLVLFNQEFQRDLFLQAAFQATRQVIRLRLGMLVKC